MTSMSFTRRIIQDNRVTIPSEVMELLELELGEMIHVTVEKLCKEQKDDGF